MASYGVMPLGSLLCDNLLIVYAAVQYACAQNSVGRLDCCITVFATFVRARLHRSTRPFCHARYGHDFSILILFWVQNAANSPANSLPQSVYTFLGVCASSCMHLFSASRTVLELLFDIGTTVLYRLWLSMIVTT